MKTPISYSSAGVAEIAVRHESHAKFVTFELPTEEKLRALGEVVIRHSQLEFQLIYCLKTLCGLSVDEAVAEHRRPFISKLRTLVKEQAEARLTDQAETAAVINFLKEVEDLTTERNDVVHGYWLTLPGGSREMKRCGENRPEPSTEYLLNLAKRLDDLRVQINTSRLTDCFKRALPYAQPVKITFTSVDRVTASGVDLDFHKSD